MIPNITKKYKNAFTTVTLHSDGGHISYTKYKRPAMTALPKHFGLNLDQVIPTNLIYCEISLLIEIDRFPWKSEHGPLPNGDDIRSLPNIDKKTSAVIWGAPWLFAQGNLSKVESHYIRSTNQKHCICEYSGLLFPFKPSGVKKEI